MVITNQNRILRKAYTYILVLLAVSSLLDDELSAFNSIAIILLISIWLLKGSFKTKFNILYKQPLFWFSLLYFLLYIFSIFLSADKQRALHFIQKLLPLLILPIVLLSEIQLSTSQTHLIFKSVVYSCAVLMTLATILAFNKYIQTHNNQYLYYHSLAMNIKSNAIFDSTLCFISILLLTKINIDKKFKYLLFVLFSIWIIFLASRLFLLILVLFIFYNLFKLPSQRIKTILTTILIISITLAFIFPNPVKDRFEDFKKFHIQYLKEKRYNENTYFDGISLRLIYLKFSLEILHESKNYLLGVGTGDAEQLLKNKIRSHHMYIGDKKSDNQGYLRFTYHDVYMQSFVSMGILGLVSFLAIIIYILSFAIKNKMPLLIYLILIFAISSFTDVITIYRQTLLSLYLLLFCLLIRNQQTNKTAIKSKELNIDKSVIQNNSENQIDKI